MPSAAVQAQVGPRTDGALNEQTPEEAQMRRMFGSRLQTIASWMAKAVAWHLLVLCCYSYFLYGTGMITVNVEHPWVARVLEYWGVSLTVSSMKSVLFS